MYTAERTAPQPNRVGCGITTRFSRSNNVTAVVIVRNVVKCPRSVMAARLITIRSDGISIGLSIVRRFECGASVSRRSAMDSPANLSEPSPEKLRQQAAILGLTADGLAPNKIAGAKFPIKYQDENGNTWSGKGIGREGSLKA
jgi:hypothetical protein